MVRTTGGGRTWLVTGGAGFIGSHLVETLLARGDRVRVLDDLSTGRRDNLPAGVELVVGDVADPAPLRDLAAGVDGCFHLAAVASVQRGHDDWIGTHRTNLTGTIAVFDAARRRPGKPGVPGVPVVYASSAAVYGDNPRLPLDEASETRPLSGYGADKLGCELHGRVAAGVHGVPNTGLRFFNVYGPRQDARSPYAGVIASFADRARTGRPLRIDGDGGASRDFVHVADAVAHLLAAMDRLTAMNGLAGGPGSARVQAQADVFCVCTGRPTTVAALAAGIRAIAGSDSPVMHGPPRPGDIRRSVGDPGRAIRALGVRAAVALEPGLRQTLGMAGPGLPGELRREVAEGPGSGTTPQQCPGDGERPVRHPPTGL